MLADRVRIGANGINRDIFPKVIDNFEDINTLGNYTIENENRTNFKFQNSIVYSGNFSLEVTRLDDFNTNGGIISLSGLNHYPKKGDVFSVFTRGLFPSFFFGVQSGNPAHRYRLSLNNYISTEPRLLLEKYSSHLEGFETLASIVLPFTVNKDEWVELRVNWKLDGTIESSIVHPEYGMESISVLDTTYDSGGVGFGYLGLAKYNKEDDANLYFDECTILNPVNI
jgi:hypothetical protein